MVKKVMSETTLNEIIHIIPQLVKMTSKKLWIDYDTEADVLYINFKRPQQAMDSEMLENGIIIRYKENKIVGLTILDASSRE